MYFVTTSEKVLKSKKPKLNIWSVFFFFFKEDT